MFKKEYKMTEEHKRKIGLANYGKRWSLFKNANPRKRQFQQIGTE